MWPSWDISETWFSEGKLCRKPSWDPKGFSYLCSFFEFLSFKKDFYDLGNETGQIATTTTIEATLKPQYSVKALHCGRSTTTAQAFNARCTSMYCAMRIAIKCNICTVHCWKQLHQRRRHSRSDRTDLLSPKCTLAMCPLHCNVTLCPLRLYDMTEPYCTVHTQWLNWSGPPSALLQCCNVTTAWHGYD